MTSFKWDKSKYENADEIEALVEQAIKFGSKKVEKNISEVEKNYQQQLEAIQTELNGVKNQSALNEILSRVPNKNKEVVSKLINNDPTKIDEVKEKYAHLFEDNSEIYLKDILLKNQMPDGSNINRDGNQLKQAYEKGETLTSTETEKMWEYVKATTK